MFMMHISILFALSVLLASTALIIWSLRNKGAGSTFGKVIGFFIFILSLLSLLCIGYSGVKLWKQGNVEAPMEMRKEMMQKMMPMMMERMREHMGKMQKKQTKDTQTP